MAVTTLQIISKIFAAVDCDGRLFTFSFILIVFCGCQKDERSDCDDAIGIYSHANYQIGTAIDLDELENSSLYKSIAIKQFNSITPENILKFQYIHPEPYLFRWKEADSLVSFAKSNNKRLHGHTLIWHQQLPQWIFDFKGNTADWEQLMKTHIQTVMAHFKNKVNAWDLINEAFNEDGQLRNSIWKQKIGPRYIEKAILFAREVDPNVLLFYNDFNLESNTKKLESVLDYLDHLKSRGIVIDGIGVQMHISTQYPDPSQIANTLHKIANRNYRIHVSELDISINPLGKDIEVSEKLFNAQANTLGQLIQHYNQLPKGLQYGITFWGISDKNSWIRDYFGREDYPLLFDDNYQPKPCYCKLINTL